MNLRRRLERLESSSAGALAAPPESARSVERTLASLRLEMQALIERSAPQQAPVQRASRRPPATDALPFTRLDSGAGVTWQRLEVLSDAHWVGRVRVADLARAEAAVLAELALDPRLAGSAPPGWLFLDLETTGLAGAGTLAFLVGMAWMDASGGIVVEQLLLREPADERALLERVAERIDAAHLVISFNGKAFDRPLLDSRCVMNRLRPLPSRPHLDLLHVGRRLHRPRLQRCTLSRLERDVLGFHRGQDVSGAEVPAIYAHFLRSGEGLGMRAVVDHNFWDVVSMVALVALYGQRSPELDARDLASLAFTLKRAGATLHAERVAEVACARGGGIDALRVRAALSKSRGDAVGAVRDLEQVCEESDDPAGRLELAKLYEHAMRTPSRALYWVLRGTSEAPRAQQRRRERLERKIRRNSV